MSIRGMQQRFAVRLRYVLYALIAVFVVGLPFVFTPGLTRRNQEETPKEGKDIIARVNGQPVQSSQLEDRFDQTLGQLAIYAQLGQSVSLQQLAQLRLSAFQQAVTDALLRKQAEIEGIKVSRGDINKRAEQIADQQLEQLRGQYKGDQLEPALGRLVAMSEKRQQAGNMSPAAFRKWMVDRLLESRDALSDELTMQKLEEKVTASVGTSEQDLLASYDRLKTREILVSLKPKGKPARTEEEARKRGEELAARAKQGEDFAALATAESDDERGKKNGGEEPTKLLSAFSPNMQKVVANMKPGDVTAPMKIAAGYIITKMESRPRDLPKDFEKSKSQLLTSLVQRRKSEAWQEYTRKLQQSAKVEVTDPEILAYQAMQRGKDADALDQLQKAAAQSNKMRGLAGGIVYYNLAMIYVAQGKWKEAADNFTSAADSVSQDQKQALPGARAEALMGLAEANEKLAELAQKPEEKSARMNDALLWYQEASNWADTPPVHNQLIATYQRLGKADLVKKEQDWLKEYEQAQLAKQQAMLEQQQKAAGAQPPAAPSNAKGTAQTRPAPSAPRPTTGEPAPAPRGR